MAGSEEGQTEMKFYLGIHQARWLAESPVPTFLSANTLRERVRLPTARTDWALDSGGFTELSKHGEWVSTPEDYVELVQRCQSECGMLDFAAIQDWMCEPEMVTRTGLSVLVHQTLTIESYLELMELDSSIPWLPVLQGWTHGDYLDHLEAYAKAGVDLTKLERVGIGSVCRRQNTMRVGFIIRDLASMGLKLHAFGFKVTGLRDVAEFLTSADSMAWSFEARKQKGDPNSLATALEWREKLPPAALAP